MAQCLRIYLPIQGMRVQSLVRELRYHMLWGKQAYQLQLLSLCATIKKEASTPQQRILCRAAKTHCSQNK